MKKLFILIACVLSLASCACTVVDNSEVCIKFNKFSVTEQGKLEATPCTGYTFYNPITTAVFKYPVFIQRVDYNAFTVNTPNEGGKSIKT